MPNSNHAAAPAASLTTFNFHGDQLDVVTTPDGAHWVALTRLCAPLGIGPDEQVKKLKMLDWAQTVKITVWENALKREVFCLSIKSVAGWLFTINAGKVRPELRGKLIRYQRECADVLADHFLGKRGAVPAGYLSPDQHVAQLEPHRRRAAELEVDRDFLRETNKVLLASARSTICADELDSVLRLEHRISDLWLPLGLAKSSRGAIARIRHRSMPGCYCKGFRLKHIPRELVPKILRELEIMLADAIEAARAKGILPMPKRRRPTSAANDPKQVVIDFGRMHRVAKNGAAAKRKKAA
jgi:hypothetical protein